MTARLVDVLAELEPEHAALVMKMTDASALLGASRDFLNWAHDGQKSPPGDWRTWVLKAGRGYGKTRTGAEWVAAHARNNGTLKIALVAATLAEARSIMVDGEAGLLAVAGDEVARWMPSRGLLRFTSGAEAALFSGASPEQLRGPQHHIAWCDELAKWEKPGATWDMLQLGMRLGEHPQVLVTTTPRAGPALARILATKGCVVTGGKTRENPHLPVAFVETVEELYAGTRLGRQELDGELLPDVAGALWSVELLERCRVGGRGNFRNPFVLYQSSQNPFVSSADETPIGHAHPHGLSSSLEANGEEGAEVRRFTRTVIGVDPPSGDGTCGIIACAIDADGIGYVLPNPFLSSADETPIGHAHPHGLSSSLEANGEEGAKVRRFVRTVIGVDPPSGDGTCGIIACAIDANGIGYVLADHSVTACSPERWASAVAAAAGVHGAQMVVAETNQGGTMVEAVLRAADARLRVKSVQASMSKSDRAVPVAARFEAGKVRLCGRFEELEAELCGMIAGGGYEGPGRSPDRADAMVWALTELMLGKEQVLPRITIL